VTRALAPTEPLTRHCSCGAAEALAQDVEITVGTKPRNQARGPIRIIGEARASGGWVERGYGVVDPRRRQARAVDGSPLSGKELS
jgi:hypothetical protein